MSYPKVVLNEAARINLLMEREYDVFHLRKPDWTKEQVKDLLSQLDQNVLKRTALHQHYDLAVEFGIQRLHFNSSKRLNLSSEELQEMKWKDAIFSTSAHSVEEYLSLPAVFDYTFLSPVFDSISKEDYKANRFNLSKKNPHVDVIALGGVNFKNVQLINQMGFDGCAFLGSIWKKYDRPLVLSIGGFDPSGGAGVLADIKTIENHKCIGLAVQTSLTVQTEDRFLDVTWMSIEQILAQLEPLLCHYDISCIKIGLVESFEVLDQLLNYLKKNAPEAEIIWDPVLSASAGKDFHNKLGSEALTNILQKVDLVTPNSDEVKKLGKSENESVAADFLSQFTFVLLKGGHRKSEKGTDVLIDSNGGVYSFPPADFPVYEKHGTGCIFSSAVASNFALGQSVDHACENAKRYVEKVMASNKKLLAYHVG